MSEYIIIGHRNPDTDSICSAIAYAHYLNEHHHIKASAACCGEINPRTQLVLDEAGLPPPRLLMNVQPTAVDVCNQKILSAHKDEAFHSVYRRMQKHKVRAMPVVDKDGKLEGILSLTGLLELLLPRGNHSLEEPRKVHTSLNRIAQVNGGTFANLMQGDNSEDLLVTVGAMKADTFLERIQHCPPEKMILVAGNRPSIQKQAIAYGARLLVISGGFELDAALLDEARKKDVSVLISPHDTATTTLLIRGSADLEPVIEKDFVSFPHATPVRRIRREVESSDQDLFPVIDDHNKLTGVFTKSALLNPPRKKIVLVDHNELAQAVAGIDEAEVLEVIDHHRMGGGLVTSEPIRFVNDTVGSTCTIIGRFMRDADYKPPRNIGLCLAAGIIADTLTLSSPTATNADRTILGWLAEVCDIDVEDFSRRFFSAGSLLEKLSPEEALKSDCKFYEENDWSFAAAQIEEVGEDRFLQYRSILAEELDNLVRHNKLDFACLMMTDITCNSSLLLCAGSESLLSEIDYPRLGKNIFKMEGVVSRKKQLLPHLSRLTGQLEKSKLD